VIAEGLESEDPGLRAEAARALGALGEVAAPFVPELTAALADSDASVRVAAIDALGRGGAAARRAVPVLSARLVNGTEAEREAVTDAFARLGPFADAGVDGLLRLLRDGDPGDRIRAARALAAIGPAALPAVPELEERIARRDAASAACARALGQIGPAASGSLDTLVARASTADGDERTAICEALGGLLPVDERVAEILLEASREGPVVDRRRAARALLRVATHADRSEWILPLVHHDDPRIAAWAERRLATVEAAGGREPADATEDRAAIRAGNGASP